jgi:hypothetical protein
MARPFIRQPFPLGLRVVHQGDGRGGFVVGKAETHGKPFSLIPVHVEGSTRRELWPEHYIHVRPKREQFPDHGGRYVAPAGYPLNRS